MRSTMPWPAATAATAALRQHPRGGPPPAVLRGSPSASTSAFPPASTWPAACRRGRFSRLDRGLRASYVAALVLTVMVLALVLSAMPVEAKKAAKKPSPKKPAGKKSDGKKAGGKSPKCSPTMCMTVAKLEKGIKTARDRLVKMEKVPASKAAGIAPLVRARAKPCKVGGKPVKPPTVCFKESAEMAVGAAYAALLRKHGKHVTKSTPFGMSKKKGLVGCQKCEAYYFPFGVSCCYIGCTAMNNLVGSSVIYLDGCCVYLHGRCERSASVPAPTQATYWTGF